jgi:hypothetical protein
MLINSETSTSTFNSAPNFRSFFPSRMDGEPRRRISLSFPSGKMMTGFEPVVLANTVKPASLRQAAMSLATLDFPLVPVTQILKGMDRTVLIILKRSTTK